MEGESNNNFNGEGNPTQREEGHENITGGVEDALDVNPVSVNVGFSMMINTPLLQAAMAHRNTNAAARATARQDIPADFLNIMQTIIDQAPRLFLAADNVLHSYTYGTLSTGMARMLLQFLEQHANEMNGVIERNIPPAVTGLCPCDVELRMQSYRLIGADQEIPPEEDVGSCCVCMEKFAMNDELGKLDCGHEFHYNCIQSWLAVKNSCPLCNQIGLGLAPQN